MITLEEKIKNRRDALESKEPEYDHVTMIHHNKRTLIQVKPKNIQKRIDEGFKVLRH